MNKRQIELGVDYKLRHTNTGTGRVRFVSLTPPATPADYPIYSYGGGKVAPAYGIRAGELPAEQWIDGAWRPVLVRPADVASRWDDPAEVAKRERLTGRQAQAGQAVEILRALGFTAEDPGGLPGVYRRYDADHPRPEARITHISSAPNVAPLVEIDVSAFLARLADYLPEGGA